MGAAAIIGGIGVATQLAGTVVNFAQAKKQKELKEEADRAATQAMAKQDNLLRTNYAEQLQVPLEAYEQASQANAAIQAQNIDALTQAGGRALMGGVGRTMAAGDAANERMRMQMQRDLYRRNQLIAAEDDRIRNMRRDVELQRTLGAQQAAAQAEIQRQRNIAQGIQGIGNAVGTGLQSAHLYAGIDGSPLFAGGGRGPQSSPTNAGNIQYIETPKDFSFNYLDSPQELPPITQPNIPGGVSQVDLGGGFNYTWDTQLPE